MFEMAGGGGGGGIIYIHHSNYVTNANSVILVTLFTPLKHKSGSVKNQFLETRFTL